MESKKNGSEVLRGRTGIKTDVENGLVDTGRGKGKLGRSEWHGHIYTTKCKIDS